MNPIEIASPADFAVAVPAAFAEAAARDARSMLWVDPDFTAWPLDDPALLAALTAFVRRPLRRLVMLARRYDRLERAHPRFTQWRATWAHAVDAREPPDPERDELPTLLLDDGPVVLELWDPERMRGRALRDAAVAAAARDRIDVLLQQSSPAWPVRPLGL